MTTPTETLAEATESYKACGLHCRTERDAALKTIPMPEMPARRALVAKLGKDLEALNALHTTATIAIERARKAYKAGV